MGGSDFLDVSGISGADDIADSRTWVRWDFDKDGRTDIAVVNANRPLLSLYRNRLPEAGTNGKAGFIALRFQGSNDTAISAKQKATRDGYGARVVVETADLKVEREHRCGEGYAGQNSATMIVGIGTASEAKVTVHWPGGGISRSMLLQPGDLALCEQGLDSATVTRYGK